MRVEKLIKKEREDKAMKIFVDLENEEFSPQIIRNVPSIEFFLGRDRNNFVREERSVGLNHSTLLICSADFAVAAHLCLPYWDKKFFNWVGIALPMEATWMFNGFKEVDISEVPGKDPLNTEGLFIRLLPNPQHVVIDHDPQYVVIDHGSWKKVQVHLNTVSVAILRYFMTVKKLDLYDGFTEEFRRDLQASLIIAQSLL